MRSAPGSQEGVELQERIERPGYRAASRTSSRQEGVEWQGAEERVMWPGAVVDWLGWRMVAMASQVVKKAPFWDEEWVAIRTSISRKASSGERRVARVAPSSQEGTEWAKRFCVSFALSWISHE